MTNKPNKPNNPNKPNTENTMQFPIVHTDNLPIHCHWDVAISTPEGAVPGSIYLDGAYRSPMIDMDRKIVSFDHHEGCIRAFTLATCQQVRNNLELGFPHHLFNRVVINDIDADTVLSCWLLSNPDRCNEPKVVDLVDRIGWVDANYMATRSPHPMHFAISANPRDPNKNSVENLTKFMTVIDQFLDGSFTPDVRPYPPVRVLGISAQGKVVFDDVAPLLDAYQVAPIAIGCVPGAEGTIGYVVGKASEWVQCDMFKVREIAQSIEPDGDSDRNWGGSSTVGGAVFYPSGKRSSILPEKLVEIIAQVIQIS